MISPEMQRFLREEIGRHLNIVLSGQAGDNASVQTETINNLYPSMPQIQNRPVMHPYGFASRAPANTISVTARQGASPQNRVTLGHRDPNRPTDLGAGDSAIYSSDGKTVLAFVKVLKDELTFSTGSGAGIVGKFSKDGKVSLANPTGELVDLVSQILAKVDEILQGVATGTVTTLLGEELLKMPAFAVQIAEYELLRTQFDTFKAGA